MLFPLKYPVFFLREPLARGSRADFRAVRASTPDTSGATGASFRTAGAVSSRVPGLPGCHSQGNTEAEALANIADAIREYLAVVQELAQSAGTKLAEVEV